MKRVLSNNSYDLDAKVMVRIKGQIMYFLVNASSKPLDVATSNLPGT